MSHIADVAGIAVGHAADADGRTGTTAVVCDVPAIAGVSVLGGAPGTRETDALGPAGLAPGVDAVVLSGGSAFGLAAADGAARVLHATGRGFEVREHRVPIVPAAIVFDLSGPPADYAVLGAQSTVAALQNPSRAEGSVGAGTGARTARLKGGVGSASEEVAGGHVGALAVVNAVGSPLAANGPWFRAKPFERDGEFGNLPPAPADADFQTVETKLDPAPGQNTTIVVVATDIALTRAEAHRLAICGQDGIALALYPAHTTFDGDTVFALSTARVEAPQNPRETIAIGAAASRAVARAIARAIFHATPVAAVAEPTWHQCFGR